MSKYIIYSELNNTEESLDIVVTPINKLLDKNNSELLNTIPNNMTETISKYLLNEDEEIITNIKSTISDHQKFKEEFIKKYNEIMNHVKCSLEQKKDIKI